MLKDGDKGAILQRDKETYAIAPHLPCGVVTPEILRKLADVAEKYHAAAVKVTSASRIALVGLREEDVDRVWEELGVSPGAAVGVCVRSIKACPGTSFCRLGQQDSLNLGMALDQHYHGMELPGKMKMGVSGCPNQCAETPVKDIGLVGKKHGWTVMAGGCAASKPRLADVVAEDMTTEEAEQLVARMVGFFRENAKKHERIGRMIDRIGLEGFKQAVGASSA